MQKPVNFCLPYAVAIVPGLSFAIGGWGYGIFLVVYLGFPLLDFFIGKTFRNPSSDQEATLSQQWRYAMILWGYALIQLSYLAVGSYLVEQRQNWFDTWFFAMNTGLLIGAASITVAHELVHKTNRFERGLGGFMLALVCYGTFKVEHVRGHHVNVSTPKDASSARLGQSIYHFVPQAMIRNVFNGFRLEAKRLQRKGLSPLHWRNEVLGWTLLSVVVAVACLLLTGAHGLVFFLVSSFFAVLALEIVNYVEHYGLERRQLANGRYERVSPLHSWNASEKLANAGIYNLQRHSDHHAFPTRRYQILRHYDQSPQLPTSYGGMIILALFPPLWHKVMDPLAKEHMEKLQQSEPDPVDFEYKIG
ncbi:alkane 1-monooxygenase [Spartinivicinus poritis]|uniref:Alkane 1-monooxygenase n=1 Tax=Spartinivicinus poritis TaxID=2994640 RepID=A0ABT5UE33_9GAMM|nr:alkane 1-monooxygenase [Spartinivicinus sp. A2-2]MDE1463349.1 alkane 1-monooxygenase [Spartinivicinus sp. A2-2]